MRYTIPMLLLMTLLFTPTSFVKADEATETSPGLEVERVGNKPVPTVFTWTVPTEVTAGEEVIANWELTIEDEDASSMSELLELTYDPSVTTVTLTKKDGLATVEEYRATIKANYISGEDSFDQTVYFYTGFPRVKGVRAPEKTVDSVLLEWTENAKVIGVTLVDYRIKVYQHKDGQEPKLVLEDTTSLDYKTVTDLFSGTRFYYQVRAESDGYGQSQWSKKRYFKTLSEETITE